MVPLRDRLTKVDLNTLRDTMNDGMEELYLKVNSPDIIDFNKIFKQITTCCNRNLINYFFKKAKLKENFTYEEMEAYSIAWTAWFDLVFTICKHNTFQFSGELDDISLIINKDGELYQMSMFDNLRQIIYLGNNLHS